MFTGLVEAVGNLLERTPTPGGARLRIGTALAGELQPGDSLAVNGVCLTVVTAQPGEVHADIGPETLRVTTLGTLPQGAAVNLERPLRADSRLGGHFVQGHVDAVGYIEDIRVEDNFHWFSISVPQELAPYLIQKGSIAVDGISLTVATLAADCVNIMIVPFTLAHTNLGSAKAQDRVNLECDMVGKYVVRAAQVAGLNFSSVHAGEVTH
jgi:riboflavin synthase